MTSNIMAVLPFVNMKYEAEDKHFSDGSTDEVINALVKIGGLKVLFFSNLQASE
ncbi:hypothetical protein [Owenweeksia hongkongensis]|uniref:hypothetical protein n=1 Tax=Owenweeksia hongkongensis TaxID=253245 RepID=UPI003A8CAC2B